MLPTDLHDGFLRYWTPCWTRWDTDLDEAISRRTTRTGAKPCRHNMCGQMARACATREHLTGVNEDHR